MVELILKKHVRNGCLDIAVCDSKHIGKIYEEGALQLDLTGSFFLGDNTEEKEIIELIQKCRSAFIVGKKSTSITKKYYPDCTIREIKGVPFINIINM